MHRREMEWGNSGVATGEGMGGSILLFRPLETVETVQTPQNREVFC